MIRLPGTTENRRATTRPNLQGSLAASVVGRTPEPTLVRMRYQFVATYLARVVTLRLWLSARYRQEPQFPSRFANLLRTLPAAALAEPAGRTRWVQRSADALRPARGRCGRLLAAVPDPESGSRLATCAGKPQSAESGLERQSMCNGEGRRPTRLHRCRTQMTNRQCSDQRSEP